MAEIIIGSIVFAGIGFAAFSVYRSKKKGKNSCGCSCAGCKKPNNKNCH